LCLVLNEIYRPINIPEKFFFQTLDNGKSSTKAAYSPKYAREMDPKTSECKTGNI
jgi:hypothetical protein